MEKWFEKQSRLVQIILLLIPVVNWVVEILVRWEHSSFFARSHSFRLTAATIPSGANILRPGYALSARIPASHSAVTTVSTIA